MPCFSPLDAYRSFNERTKNGKAKICFDREAVAVSPHHYAFIQLPCGQCAGCRLERSRSWAVRCVHEASLHDANSFITLTYNDKYLDPIGSLEKRSFVLFMKRLRKQFATQGPPCQDPFDPLKYGKRPHDPIRFFHCGEYGAKLKRPHHHACLFNFEFPDMYLWDTREGIPLYRSPMLEKLWPFGYSSIGEVTFESAAYVARYVSKKVNGPLAPAHYSRIDHKTGEMFSILPEYISMSLRPGIAGSWIEKFSGDVYPKDFLTLGGVRFKPPKYYDKIYDRMDYNAMRDLKKVRSENSAINVDNSPERLASREACQKARTDRLVRNYENDDA